jgi:hypothetical protein
MILIIVIFIAMQFVYAQLNMIVVLTDGHKLFLPCRLKLATVRHMYRFCVNTRKGWQERNGKILLLLI